jgi:hypothetical protein
MSAAVLSQFEVVQPLVHCRPPGAPKARAKFQSIVQSVRLRRSGCTHNFILLASGVGAGMVS